jgi:hypothetical protein
MEDVDDTAGFSNLDDTQEETHAESQALTLAGLARADMPADLLAALASGHIGLGAVRNYARLVSMLNLRAPLVRGALGWALANEFMRNRLILNPHLASVLALEMSVGVWLRLVAETCERGPSAPSPWTPLTMGLALWTNVAMVVALAPVAVLGPRIPRRGLRGWLGALPASCFELGPFSPAQRAGCWLLKAVEFGAAGAATSLIASALAAGGYRARRRLFGLLPPKIEPLRSALAFGTFVGLLSSTRYQLVNALEAWLLPLLRLTAAGPLATLCSGLLRAGNAWAGGRTFVQWKRLLGAPM